MTELGTDVALHLPTELGTDVTGPGGPPPLVMYGLQSFTTPNYYESVNNPGGIAGSVSGFWVAGLFRIDSQLVGASRVLAARTAAAPNAGWYFVTAGTNGSVSFTVCDGAGVFRQSAAYPIPASSVGKILIVVGVHDGSSVRLYVNRQAFGGGAAISGYTAATDRTWIGRRASGNPASEGTIFGVCGGNGVPTLAEIQTQADAAKIAGDIVGIPGKTDSLWSAKQDQAGTAPALLEDKIGTEDMERVGTPVLVQVTNPVWGW